MNDLIDFALQTKFEKVKKLRNNLEEFNKLLNWRKFLKYFPTRSSFVGRPEYEKILMIKILFLQSCYNLSDEELEYQIHDRFSFQQFLNFPESIPDYSTIWRFREELTEGNLIEDIWSELQRQMINHGITIEKGVIQDAKFITADPGKKHSGMTGRGREAKTSRNADGSWTKKGKKNIFGYKMHTKVDLKTKLITCMGLSTAKTHDGRVDLAENGEVIYRDRGYSGMGIRAKGDATMKRGKLEPHEILRNKRISRLRCRGEHPYGTMTRSLKAGHTKLTTLTRVYIQQTFVCIVYNLHRLKFLLKNLVA